MPTARAPQDGNYFHIEPAGRYIRGAPGHIVYAREHIREEEAQRVARSCGVRSTAAGRANGTVAELRRERRKNDEDKNNGNNDGSGGANSDCRASSGKCSCKVTVVADYTFILARGGADSAAQFMVNQLVSADEIYRQTYFNGVKGYGLAVGSIQLYAQGVSGTLDAAQSVDSLLDSFSYVAKKSTSASCHAHLFTHRNFQGTLGLAFIGTMCYSGVNTGLTSSYGTSTSTQLLTLTHEIGHGWGADHDPAYQDTCSPSGTFAYRNGGNYIMYPSSPDGSMQNHRRFSPCSASAMSSTLKKAGCLVKSGPHCGNGVVDDGEECDCGGLCDNSCCTTSCTVNTAAGYQCSPQNPLRNPCCTKEDGRPGQCMFVQPDANKHCDDENDCTYDTVCGGSSAQCPDPPLKPDGTECGCVGGDCNKNPNTGTSVCSSGRCDTWLCEVSGAAMCQLDDAPCTLGCIGPGWGDEATCISTFDAANRPADTLGGGRHFSEGRACRALSGYCNRGGQCISSGDDVATRWRALGGMKFSWALGMGLGCGLLLALHLYVRRTYRVPHGAEYKPLGTLAGAGAVDYGTSTPISRTGWEVRPADELECGSDCGPTSDGAAPAPPTASPPPLPAELYEQERQAVILEELAASAEAAADPAALEEVARAVARAADEDGLCDAHADTAAGLVAARRALLASGGDGDGTTEGGGSPAVERACAAADRARRAVAVVVGLARRKVDVAYRQYERDVAHERATFRYL